MVTALVISAWNQYWQSRKINELQSTLQQADKAFRIRARIRDYLQIQPPNGDAVQLIRKLMPPPPDTSKDQGYPSLVQALHSNVQLADVDGKIGGLEILSLSSRLHSIPGNSESVSILFDDYCVIDAIVKETGARQETHTVEIKDTNGDGEVDLIYHCTPGFLSNAKGSVVIYYPTHSGFKLNSDR